MNGRVRNDAWMMAPAAKALSRIAGLLVALAASVVLAVELITLPENAVLQDTSPGATARTHRPPPTMPDWFLTGIGHTQLEYKRWNCAYPESGR